MNYPLPMLEIKGTYEDVEAITRELRRAFRVSYEQTHKTDNDQIIRRELILLIPAQEEL